MLLPLIPWPTDVAGTGDDPVAVPAIRVDTPDPAVAALVAEQVEAAGVPVSDDPAEGRAVPFTLQVDPAAGPDGSDAEERYTLRVGEGEIRATAAAPVGLLHAARTLRQLVTHPAAGGAPVVAPVVVHDAPRYAWRGLSLDVVRHWFGPDDLRAVVDLVASFKLRVLHLHLTDDQGWRIEIPSRPELERAADHQVGGGPAGRLTVDDYQALQEYAAARHVTIVPEFDMPGHVNAATHVYGALTSDGVPTDAYDGIEVGFSRLWFDNPATEPFLRDVIGDLARMTRGPWVHVGGDEVLTMEVAEFARFVELAARIVREHGKTPIFWQEGARGPVEPGTLLQYWEPRGEDLDRFVAAAEAGARFVMSPGDHAYLDMKYTAEHPLGLEWAGHVELRDAYEWEPTAVIDGLPASAVEGVSAAIWTETLTTRDELFSMLLPRLGAVAEVAWTAPERKDFDGFTARTAASAPSWTAAGWAFHPTPQVAW
ncbi:MULTISPECIES: family 20 glycosylhydrolase [unclassified Isoptericola]|uniref:family 20 glycosylhydrolase n=1 Tax=unclassified Isoptericola TaxID=2623355 RepID=UPI002713C4EC|nr:MULTISPECIES: family 20 glycosylhydrolase [unclassified Isoptericola]MDO8144005.1 family 20 glycosylhydrolase [Isoptericola sp. 178]MDO8149421.1 family 20 glycosylhydrolase [Isoptericola sp. b515]